MEGLENPALVEVHNLPGLEVILRVTIYSTVVTTATVGFPPFSSPIHMLDYAGFREQDKEDVLR